MDSHLRKGRKETCKPHIRSRGLYSPREEGKGILIKRKYEKKKEKKKERRGIIFTVKIIVFNSQEN